MLDGDGNELAYSADDDETLCSKLGTKEHWIEHYKMELKNYEEFGDIGEIWFGYSIEKRLVNYIIEKAQLPRPSKFVVDFGCGNGSLLRALRKKGYSQLCGIDCSEEAIMLARKLAESEYAESNLCEIDFQVADLLAVDFSLGKFDVVIDKGTWDALSLSPDREYRLVNYRANVCKSLRHLGLFIICSCNFTRTELEKQFSSAELLRFLEELPPENTLEYGGRKGSTTTCAVFQRL